MINERSLSVDVGGRPMTFSTGKVAKQANGAIWVRYGDSIVLVTATMDMKERVGVDFLPFTVDYREYTYAGGRIPGGFFKREGRPTDREVLTSRLTDRPLRPLFPDNYHYETQVIAMLLSTDYENPTDIMALNGASLALLCSKIPFTKAVGAVRIAYVDGQYVVNPINSLLEKSLLNLTVAGTREAIAMVEASAKEVSEEIMLGALALAQTEVARIAAAQEEFAASLGIEKVVIPPRATEDHLVAEVEARTREPFREAMQVKGKLAMYAALEKVEKDLAESYLEDEAGRRQEASRIAHETMVKEFRSMMLNEGRRVDGRLFDEIRPVWCETGVLPRAHGSAIFTRGETQALANCTLGTAGDRQRLSGLQEGEERSFLLHYNFPPFSVGEVKFLRGPGRREVGHGALAEKSLLPVLPSQAEFPYTIRVVSDILESNGSSSQATICGATLALMDAGVPIKAPVAGVAMGLVMEGERYAILSDIAGLEDHYGDMDFKVAGTTAGITALQMDIKVSGISSEIMRKALDQARQGRLHLLEIMAQTIGKPRADISQYAPRIFTIMIPRAKIGELIGPGGKNIRAIQETAGVDINIEDDGTVTVASVNSDAAQKAMEMIRSQMEEAVIGTIYKGTVKRVEAYGAFVEVLPGKDGLLHVSEMDWKRVEKVEDVLKVGDQIEVQLVSVEDNGKLRLSRKVLLDKPEGYVERPERPDSRGERRPSSGRDRERRGDRPPRR
jgi:polyribonucleotide nucleotidyltransferase